MKLAVVAKQVSIKECEPRPSAHCSWITSFTDLWQTVWDIVAAFIDPSFSQVVPPRLRNAGFQKRERPGGGASQQQTAYDNRNCNSKLISQTQIQNIKSPTISANPDLPRVYLLQLSGCWSDPDPSDHGTKNPQDQIAHYSTDTNVWWTTRTWWSIITPDPR